MIIGIVTYPEFYEGEIEHIHALFEAGLKRLHLRKENASEENLSRFLDSVDTQWHNRIVVHGVPAIGTKYAIAGIHHSRWVERQHVEKSETVFMQSFPIHNREEFDQLPTFASHVVLSPLFQSISKPNYSGFWKEGELQTCLNHILSNTNLLPCALGGITPNNVGEVKQMGFTCALLLGTIWQKKPQTCTNQEIVTRYESYIERL